MVVVISVDRQTRSARVSFAVSTNFWSGTSLPRSTISKPAVSIIILTRFFPISWVSPSTTPITAFFLLSGSSSGRCGFNTFNPAYMASEQSRTSVTKYSSSSNRTLVRFMPSISPSMIPSSAGYPASINSCAASATSSSSMSTTPSDIRFNNSSFELMLFLLFASRRLRYYSSISFRQSLITCNVLLFSTLPPPLIHI